jgi:hypothetical protein
MAEGFKIADAYVDVAVKINRQKSAQQISTGLSGVDARLDVQPKVDAGKAKTEVARGLKGTAKEGDAAGRSIGNSMVKGFATIWAGGMVLDQLKRTIGAGSDLNETISKTDQVFGSSAGSIHKWATGAETSMGLSQQAAESNAGALGLLFTQVGFSSKGAADMSKSWVQLAVDLGSFNNADPTAILEAMQAATRGEYDSLQQFVPMINAATVETKALALSGKANADQLTAQDKALAINALMFEQTGKAQGDFARTQDGVANQTKIAKAQIENMRAELGGALLPIVAKAGQAFTGTLVPGIRGTVDAIQSLPAPIQGALSGLAGFAGVALAAVAAMYGISKAKGKVTESFDEMGIDSKKAATAMKFVGAAAAIYTVASAADALGDSMRGLGAETDDVVAGFNEWVRTGKLTGDAAGLVGDDFGELGNAANDVLDPSVFDKFEKATVGLIGISGVTDDAKTRFEELDDALVAMDTKQAAATFDEITRKLKEQGYSAKEINGLLPEYKNKVDTAAEAAKNAAPPTKTLTEQTEDLGDAVKDLNEQYKSYQQALIDAGLLVLDQRAAQSDYQQSLDDANESLKTNGKTLDLNTQKGRDNQAALDGIAQAGLNVLKSSQDAGESIEVQTQKVVQARKDYVAWAVSMGMPRAKAEALAESILKIPVSRETKLTAEKKDADAKIADLNKQLKNTTDPDHIAKIKGDIADLKTKKKAADQELAKIRNAKTVSKINADIRALQTQKNKANAELVRLGKLKPTPKVNADIREAQKKRASIQADIDRLRGKTVNVNVRKNTYDYRYIGTFYTTGQGDKHTGGGSYHGRSAEGGWGSQAFARGMADGGTFNGWMRGPGTGTSDTAGLVALSNNEFVIRAREAMKLRQTYPGLLEAMNNGTFAPMPGRQLDLGTYKPGGGGGMTVQNMTVVIDAKSVAEMNSVVDFMARIGQEYRRNNGRRVTP